MTKQMRENGRCFGERSREFQLDVCAFDTEGEHGINRVTESMKNQHHCVCVV